MATKQTPRRKKRKKGAQKRYSGNAGPLTARQQAFVEEYIIDLNATQAAIRAGYSVRTSHAMGCQLLKNPKVAAAIAHAKAERAKRTQVDADRVLLELARIGLADIRELFTWDARRCTFVPSKDLTADQAAAISSVKSRRISYKHKNGTREDRLELEIKLWDKVAALKEMGKHLGISERVDLVLHDELSELTDRQLAEQGMKEARKLLKVVA